MKAYPEYKNSGVRWIGKIPTHWNSVRIKYSDNVIMGQSPSSEDYNLEQIGLPFLQGNADFTELHPVPRIWCSTANKTTQSGDLLLSVRAPVGAVNIADQAYGIGRGLCAIRAEKTNPKLLFYFLLAMNEELNSNGTGSTYTAISVDDVRNIYILNIPLPEQQAIADFLDRKTAQIDTLVEKKQRQIELLQEQRTALINHAVTKGLNPNVRMKDSGVEWLGEIPSHWELKRLGWITSVIMDIDHKMPSAVEEGVPFLSAKDLLSDGTLNFENDVKKISEEDFRQLSRKVQPKRNDIIYSRIGARLGKARLVETDQKFLVSYSCCVVRVLEELAYPEYICFIMDSEILLTEAKARTVGIGVPDLGLGEIAKFPIPLPPKPEQENILAYLKKKDAKIKSGIKDISNQIALLQEYRTALISEAVTGKIDVRTVHE